jgi:serine/threonine-protein kinase
VSDDRWRRIEELCHDALERDAGDRAAFVREACGDDELLRREVESLLVNASLSKDSRLGIADLGLDPICHQIGVYQIVSLLGAGGMGEVYRARDTTLGRDVAIKILPSLFTSDPDRLARFEREARVLASLNHPHIGAIYGLEDADGVRALVLELVDGETLADRIARGPIPVNDTLTITRQIADALDAAHEKGIIHRDLKPANIKITPDGVVKVLDFGLAKAAVGDGAPADLTQSPTMTVGGTREGVILGTAAYMSPEQARGQPVDKRTDIWAFGCVLYEMLTGRSVFARSTLPDTLAGILENEPDWNVLPERTPPLVRRILRRCLEKDVRRRLRDIGDARSELEDAFTDGVAARPDKRWWRSYVTSAVIAGGVFALVTALLLSRYGQPASQPVLRTSIMLPDGLDLARRAREYPLALSPDGERLALVGERSGGGTSLYLRELNAIEPAAIPGTEGASNPFFSADGRWIGFFANAALLKVLVSGGTPILICKVDGRPMGADWAGDTIVFGTYEQGLFKVSAQGGMSAPLFQSRLAVWPDILPDRRTVLFTLGGSVLLTIPLQGGTPSVVARRSDALEGVAARAQWLQASARDAPRLGAGWLLQARYSPTGHLVYGQAPGVVRAVAFDLASPVVTGSPISVIDSVYEAPGTGAVYFAISNSGLLAYSPETRERELVWVDRTGFATPIGVDAQAFRFASLSPEGERIAISIDSEVRRSDIWIYDVQRRTRTRLTTDQHNLNPIWTPDGTRVWFNRGGALTSQATNGSSLVDVATPDGDRSPTSWSPDGRTLLFNSTAPETGIDIWELSLDRKDPSHPGLVRSFDDWDAVFSPDGRWVAHVSNESGRPEIFVAPYPRLEERTPITNTGGYRSRMGT